MQCVYTGVQCVYPGVQCVYSGIQCVYSGVQCVYSGVQCVYSSVQCVSLVYCVFTVVPDHQRITHSPLNVIVINRKMDIHAISVSSDFEVRKLCGKQQSYQNVSNISSEEVMW